MKHRTQIADSTMSESYLTLMNPIFHFLPISHTTNSVYHTKTVCMYIPWIILRKQHFHPRRLGDVRVIRPKVIQWKRNEKKYFVNRAYCKHKIEILATLIVLVSFVGSSSYRQPFHRRHLSLLSRWYHLPSFETWNNESNTFE
jgi:hypothetical protein